MNVIRIALLLLSISFASEARAQDNVAISRAAVEHLSRVLVHQPLTVNPGLLVVAPGLPREAPGVRQPSTVLSALNISGVASVATTEKAVECRIPTAASCKTNGFAAFVMLSAPDVKGNDATIRLYLRTARDLTPADSAQIRERHKTREAAMKAPGYRGPAFNTHDSTKTFERRQMSEGVLYEFTCKRLNSLWTVVSSKIIGQS